MLKKRGIVLFLTIFLVFSLFAVLILAQSPTDTGCCTALGHANACGTQITRQSCNDDNRFYNGISCDQVAACQTGPGCCTDSCNDAASNAAECRDVSSFQAGSCDTISACAEGCCFCENSAGACQVASFGKTQSECTTECNQYNLEYRLDFSGSSCACPDTVTKHTVKGNVTDNKTKAKLSGVTVTIPGFPSVTTNTQGKYEIDDVPPGKYFITIDDPGYLKYSKQIDVPKDLPYAVKLLAPAQGLIKGKITRSDTNAGIAGALVTVSGPLSVNVFTDSEGNYQTPFLKTGKYKVTAVAESYASNFIDVTLSAGTNTANLKLTKLQIGDILVRVKDKDGDALSIADVNVETGQSCTTDNEGKCTLVGAYTGQQDVTVSKSPLYPAVSKPATVVADKTSELSITLQVGKVCTFNNEKIIEGSCAAVNKPVRCIDADKNEIEYSCGGNNACGCPTGYNCLSSGYCLRETDVCTDDCTKLSDNRCFEGCDNVGGCSFYNDATKDLCKNEFFGTLKKLGSKDVRCCEGSPFTLQKEDCSTSADEDGDWQESKNYPGDSKCFDSECLHQSCESGTNKICLPEKQSDGKYAIKCLLPTCSNGKATETCTCGTSTANKGDYCCQLDGKIHTQTNYSSSVCGITTCATGGGICCEGNACGSGTYSKEEKSSCSVSGKTTTCCTTCLPKPDFTCDHAFQCPSGQEFSPTPNTATSVNKFGCKVRCVDVKPCVANAEIGSPYNNDACICGDAEVKKSSPGNRQKRCCATTTGTYLTQTGGVNCPSAIPKGKLKGTVFDKLAAGKPEIPYATIYIGDFGAFTTTSIDGTFETDVPAGTYDVYAGANKYKDGDKVEIKITQDTTTIQDLGIEPIKNPCEDEQRKVESFTVSHILGDVYKAKLEWTPPPCTNIVGYKITRNSAELPILSKSTTSFIDEGITDTVDYNYEISVIYTPNTASDTVKATFTRGNALCDGTYNRASNKFNEFCATRKEGKVCTTDNKISHTVVNCAAEVFGDNSFCSGPNIRGKVSCKDASQCSVIVQEAFPFGLYYDEDTCIGETTSDGTGVNYCSYDTSDTTIDSCQSCTEITDCFDYNSESACLKDNCVVNDNSECKWQTTTHYGELGKGFCYRTPKEDEEKSDEHCNICGEENSIFFNVGCTQDICDNLGDCFADAGDANCVGCGDATCEDYDSEEKCTADNEIDIASAKIKPSKDTCDIGKCKWSDITGDNKPECYKDGNDNNIPDCPTDGDISTDDSFIPAFRFSAACKKDTTAPITEINDPKNFMVGADDITLEFTTEASRNFLTEGGRHLYYCIDKDDKCIPQRSMPYSTKNTVELPKNFITPHIKGKGIYYIRFYSVDKFFNQEEIKSRSFYADITPPIIDVDYSITENIDNDDPVTDETESRISISIKLDEEAVCEGDLIDYATKDSVKAGPESSVGEITSWNVIENVLDGIYEYTIKCTDKGGNKATKTIAWRDLWVDAYRNIEKISPAEVVKSPNVDFKIKTSDAATCNLYLSSPSGTEKIGLLATSDKIEHSRSKQFPSAGSNHHDKYKAECVDVINSDLVDVSNFVFTIDQLPPETELKFESGDVIKKETGEEGWTQRFNQDVYVSLTCTDPEIDGSDQVFGVDDKSLKGCLTGEDSTCSPTESIKKLGAIDETSTLCYSCSDKGGNSVEKCGLIEIDTEPPTFSIELKDDQDEVTDVVIREVPTKFYTVTLRSSEELSKLPVLTYQVKDQAVYIPLAKVKDTDTQFTGKLFVPSKSEFDNIKGKNNAEFSVIGSDLFGLQGTKIFIGKKFTIVTLLPLPPILNNFPTTTDSAFSDTKPFKLTGLEAAGKPERTIEVRYETDKKEIKKWNIAQKLSASSAVDPNRKEVADLSSAQDSTTLIVDKDSSKFTVGDYVDFQESHLKDPTKVFYKIKSKAAENSKTKLTLDSALPYTASTYNGKISIYEKPIPRGWFKHDIPLTEGSNWFYAFTHDEFGNKGELTEIKKIIYDSTPPQKVLVSPAHTSVLSNGKGIKVSALVKDLNSGIDERRTRLKIDSTEFKCSDNSITCKGKKTFSITHNSKQFSAGAHSVKLTVYDTSGNKKEISWSFTINNNAPGPVTLVTHSNCLPTDKCYTDKKRPTLDLVFADDTSVSLTTVSLVGSTITPTLKTTPSSNIYQVTFNNDLSDGNYILEINSNPGKNFVEFAVDTTPPTLTFHLPDATNTEDVTSSGVLFDQNIYKLEFKGDLTETVTIDYYDLPSDVVNTNTYNYFTLLNLAISAEVNSTNRTINATLYDKAGNSKIISAKTLFETTKPRFSQITVKTDLVLICPTEEELKCKITSKYFKTNDKTVAINGFVDRKLQSLVLSTDAGRILPVDFVKESPFSFSVNLDLFNSQSATPIEGVTLIATDLGGNIAEYKFDIELDVFRPIADILWK